MATNKNKILVIAGAFQPSESTFKGEQIHYGQHLKVFGQSATLGLLTTWLKCGKDKTKTLAAWKVLSQQQNAVMKTVPGPYLMQLLERNGYEVELIENYFNSEFPKMEDLIKNKGFTTVAISTSFFFSAYHLDTIIAHVRRLCPDAFIIVGGMLLWKTYKCKLAIDMGEFTPEIIQLIKEISHSPESLKIYTPFLDDNSKSDANVFVVNKQGELAFLDLLKAHFAGGDWKNIDSLAYYKEGKLHFNKISDEPYSSPFCDWEAYLAKTNATFNGFFPVHAGQGCNFGCTYCDFCTVFPTANLDTIERIIEKVKAVPLVHGVRRVYFTNDNLFQTKKQGLELCKALAEADLHLQWGAFQRVWIVDEEMAEWMKKSGCALVFVGIESGSPELLKRMAKPPMIEKTLESLTLLGKQGINALSTLICGFPGETQETMKQTCDFLNSYYTDGGVNFIKIFPFHLDPLARVFGSEYRKKYKITGALTKWTHETMTSEESLTGTEFMYSQLKDTLTPVYDEALMTASTELKRDFCITRNKLARIQLGRVKATPEEEQALWKKLEELVVQFPPAPINPAVAQAAFAAAQKAAMAEKQQQEAAAAAKQ